MNDEPIALSPFRRIVLWLTLVSFVGQPLAVLAQVVADPNSAYKPQVDSAANGVTVVQITAPSGSGVSRNQYQDFNVPAQGIVLNNSAAVVQTQQAGWIAGNGNLSGGSARIILNEVTSANPSSLRGYTEVAGTRAEVIIANPNGITCDGCGFINTTRGILTTGTPVFGGSGSLDAFRVTGGNVTIQGAGLNDTATDQIDIIARAVQANAEIWANQLNVVAGANRVDYATLGTQTIAGTGSAPTVAIDVALLGGMYANKIRLVGTEAGVGVVSAGNIAAQAGDLVIDSQGRVTLSGNASATGSIAVTAAGEFGNSGTLAAKGNVDISADSVNSSGVLAAGINADGTLGSSGNLTVTTTGALVATASNLAGGNLSLTGGSLNLAGATTTANGNVALTATAGSIDHRGGILNAGGGVSIGTTAALDNEGGTIAAAGAVTIAATGAVSNRRGEIEAGGALSLQGASLDNTAGRIVAAGSDTLTIDVAGQLTNAAGTTATGSQGGVIGGNSDVAIAAGDIDNRTGTIAALDQASVTATGAIDNRGGFIGGDRLTVDAGGAVNNAGGVLEADNGLTLTAASLANDGGYVRNLLTGALSLDLVGALSNAQDGYIGSNGTLSIAAGSVDNAGGVLYAQGNLDLQSGAAVGNQGGLIQSSTSLTIAAQGEFNNVGGDIEVLGATGSATIAAASLDNRKGRIVNAGSGNLVLDIDGLLRNDDSLGQPGGVIAGAGNVSVAADRIDNHLGSLVAVGRLELDSAQSIAYANGDTVRGDGSIRMTSGADIVVGDGSRLDSLGDIEFTAGGALDNRGTVVSDTAVTIQAGSFSNSGSLQSGGSITAAISGAASNTGSLLSYGASSVTAGTFTNGATGTFRTGTDLTLTTSGALINQGILSGYNLYLTAASFDNQGAVAALNDLTTSITGAFTNRSGKLIYAGQDQYLYANVLTNEEDATLWAGRNITIQKNAAGARASSVTNDKGVIEAQNDLVVRADTLTNQGRTPTIQTTSFSDSIPYYVNGCPGPGCYAMSVPTGNAIGYDYDGGRFIYEYAPLLSAYGEQVYSSAWGFRVATQGEVNAFYARNPGASPVMGGWNFKLLPGQPRGDSHELEAGWSVGLNGTTQSVAPGSTSKAAKLLAGRDFIFDGGTLNNLSSQIAATRDVTLNGSNLVNQGQSLQRTTTSYAYHYLLSAGRHSVLAAYTNTVIENIGAVPSSITAGRNLSGTLSGSLVNDATAQPALNSRSAQNDVAVSTALPATPLSDLVGAPADPAAVTSSRATPIASADAVGSVPRVALTGGVQLVDGRVDTGSLAIPQNSLGLFTAAAPSANYLIETNPLFANRNSFLSSNYFLDRLGLDPSQTQKRLGDGNYEQNLVRDQIFALTGRRFLLPGQDGTAQYQALMDAGVSAAQRLSLTPGIDLTPAQTAALTGDIVWLVEREVAGQKVLVPQVYLSRTHADTLQADGSLIAAQNIDLQADTLANAGRISAGDGLAVVATDVTNRGILETTAATGLTQIAATRDLLNDGGTIAGGDVGVIAGRDLINRAWRFDATATAVKGVINPGQLSFRDIEVGSAGRILARNTATLTAGRDLAFAGGQLASGGDASLAAGNDLDLGTASKTTDLALSARYGRMSFNRELQGGSQISAGGDLSLAAANDMRFTGAKVDTGGSLAAIAGGDLTVGAAVDRTSAEQSFSQGKGSSSGSSYSETVKGSRLTAADNLTLVAGTARTADLAVGASRVSAGGDASLAASGDLVVASVQENRRFSSTTTGKKSSSSARMQSSTAIGSVVEAGNDLNIASGGSTTVQGSALDAGRDLKAQVTGDLALLAATSTRQESIQSSQRTRKTLETLNYELDQTRVLLSTITAGNSVDLQVGGSLAAQTATRDAEGNLQADRMTAQGVVKGADRQQVSVTGSGAGNSKVLGNLSSQGIRNGANDAFTALTTKDGQAAVASLLQNGLVSIRNAPEIQTILATPAPGGAAMTYKDDSGKVQLTLAGQARVQEIYSTLRLNETFTVTKMADQGLAQAVTLAAAIALTVAAPGAGQMLIGAAQGSVQAMVANAAFAAMTSTMVGQMAGGASFGEAFEAGLKAGTSAAITAGILNAPMIETANGMQSINQVAGLKDIAATGGKLAKFDLANLGQNLGGMALRGTVNAAVNTAIYGGSFGDAFTQSFVSDLAAVGANAVGQSGWSDGTRALAHAGIGAVAAKLTGRDALSGAIGGAGASLLNPLLDKAIGGTDGSGWGDNPALRTAVLQLGSMAATGAIATALGKDGMTAATAAQNETLNNYLTRDNIVEKYKRLQQAQSAEEQKEIARDTRKTSNRNTNQANAALDETVTANIALQQQKQDLQTLLTDPGCATACRTDAQNSIAEINELMDREGARSRKELFNIGANLLLTVAGGAEILAGKTALIGTGTQLNGLAYRAINPQFAESTIQNGFFRSGAAGRLGNDGIYANSTIKGAVAEFQYHSPGISPAVFEVRYPSGSSLVVSPPSGYFNQPLPFTQGANILRAESLRLPGTTNLLIRDGAVPGARLQ